MHACRGGWAGQAFALATSNDSGGRKSRIRRSKEERKSMVESFIKKYQQSNNGNFPSLNLAHKEVGGSFYTVRELVREIIQENRVLAPPKVSLEENGHSGFLEQHPLGSISMEPQIDLSESERVQMVTHIIPDKYQISSEGDISSSSESHPSEMDSAQIINEVTKVAVKGEGIDRTSIEDGKIVNALEVLDENPHSDYPLVTNVDHQDNIDAFSEKNNGLESRWLVNEQGHAKNDDMVDKNEEFGQNIHTETAVTEKLGAQNVETSETIKSPMNSNVVVETFPIRPVPKTIHTMDGECGELHETAGTLEDKAIQNEKKTYTQSSSGSVNKGEEKLSDLTEELNGKNRDEKVALNLQGPSTGNAKSSSESKPSVLVTELESKVSSPDATEANRRTYTSNSEDPTVMGGKSSNQDNGSLPKGISPTLDRINLETWEGESKKSTRHESNPLLALVKAFISSFVKFWTE